MERLARAGWVALAVGCGQPAERAGPPSILLLSLDTLRADRVGAFGGPPGLTPNLDRLAEESVIFTQTYAQASETLFSHASLFTSRYPSELGALAYDSVLPTGVPTLPEILTLYGYRTAAAVGGVHLTAEYGFNRGFEQFFQPTREPGTLFHTLPHAMGWLDEIAPDRGEAPFFLFLHGYDTHDRYFKPPPYGYAFADPGYPGAGQRVAQTKRGVDGVLDGRYFPGGTLEDLLDVDAPRLQEGGEWRKGWAWDQRPSRPMTEADRQHVAAVYDGSVAYADAWVGLLLAGLQERGLLDETLIVVLSDHGEHLGEEGVFGHRYFLDDAALRVPLIARLPGGKGGGRRIDAPTALLEVMPTLLEAAGAAAPAGIAGRSLWPALNGGDLPARDVVFSEGAFRMISARSAAGRLTFAGLMPTSPFLVEALRAAPLDGPSFSGDAPDRAGLRQALVEWRGSVRVSDAAQQKVSADLLQQLRDNGYWQGKP